MAFSLFLYYLSLKADFLQLIHFFRCTESVTSACHHMLLGKFLSLFALFPTRTQGRFLRFRNACSSRWKAFSYECISVYREVAELWSTIVSPWLLLIPGQFLNLQKALEWSNEGRGSRKWRRGGSCRRQLSCSHQDAGNAPRTGVPHLKWLCSPCSAGLAVCLITGVGMFSCSEIPRRHLGVPIKWHWDYKGSQGSY